MSTESLWRVALLAAGLAILPALVGCQNGGQRPSEAVPPSTSVQAARLVALVAGEPDPAKYGPELQAMLSSGDLLIRASAAHLIGAWAAHGDPALAAPAISSADPFVRALAETAYMRQGRSGMGLLNVQGSLVEVPADVLKALNEMRGPEGMGDLATLLQARRADLRRYLDGTPQEAVLAADLLSYIADAGARRVLLALSESSPKDVLAAAAPASLRPEMAISGTMLPKIAASGTAGRRAAVRALVLYPDPRFADFLVGMLHGEDLSVRRNAIRALGELGAAAPIEPLIAVLQAPVPKAKPGEPEPSIHGEKGDAIRTLGVIGTPAAVNALRQYIQAAPETPELEVQAILALAPHGDRSDIPWLQARLQSPSPLVRAAAATALGDIGNPAAQAALMLTTGDNESLVRAAIAKALGQIGTVYASQQLAVMMNDPDPTVRAMAIWGLGVTKDQGAVAALSDIAAGSAGAAEPPARIGDLYDQPQLAAIIALGRIADEPALKTLAGLLVSRSWPVRAATVQALHISGAQTPEISGALDARLKDVANLVRAEALLALKSLGKEFPPGYFQTH